ncbi:MAG: hypothetical protein KC910_12750 [Candidatus Eremiobacteraeota bacterium]|nr:hypothetical protein [Candidatus Eremiobacteraeota bacterium]
MDDAKIHAQFVSIALNLTPPLIRNRNIQTAEEAVSLYMQVYDCVIRAALAAQEQQPNQ